MNSDARDAQRRMALYDALCANPIDVVVVLDTEARYRYLSPSVERVLGRRPEEMVGRLCFDFYHPDDVPRIQRINDAGVAEAQIPRPVVMRVRHKAGHYVWIEATASPVFDPDTGELTEILGVNRDVSDRMRLENELYEAQRAETAARLAGSAAHDLNNLLTTIATLGELLEEQLAGDAELSSDARAVRHAALSAGKLTRELLGLARPVEHGAVSFAANDVVERVAGMVDRVDRRRCRVRAHLDPADPLIRGEPSRLEQILLNLALNACAAATDRPLSVTLASRLDDDRVVLSCEDDGPGIPLELHERIFEPYFTTRRHDGGTGIGLSTVKRIVEGWDGSITLESAPGKGATFRVSLPAAGSSAPAARPLGTDTGDARALVIESDPAVREAVRAFLEHAGYVTVCVSREDDARRAVERRETFSMVLADDRGQGWSVARTLEGLQDAPKILVSGGHEAPVDLGPHEVFLRKPFSSGDLFAAVRRLVGAPGN